MTINEVRRAARLADELQNLRASVTALKEDRSMVVTVKVEDLTRTYGMDRQRITFPYAKARFLEVIAREEARIEAALAELGVNIELESSVSDETA